MNNEGRPTRELVRPFRSDVPGGEFFPDGGGFTRRVHFSLHQQKHCLSN